MEEELKEGADIGSEISTPARAVGLVLCLDGESIGRRQGNCEQVLHILEHQLHHLLKLRSLIMAHLCLLTGST